MAAARNVLATILCSALVSHTAVPLPAFAQPVGLPNIGAASSSELSPGVEAELGAAIMAQGRLDPTFIDDPEVTQYLTTMGRHLANFAPSGRPDVSLFAVRDPEINAFAMPGGFIGINSGLVVSSRSESELAGVVAHEIGHVTQRHIARGMTQQSQSSAIMMATMAAALAAALAGGGGNLAVGVAAFGQAAAVNRQLGFSRDAEREADRVGFQMMSRAGYDPQGMVDMFSLLMNASRLNEGQGGGAWASTHPLSIDRLSDIQNRTRALTRSNYVDSDDYVYIRAKLRVTQGRDRNAQRSVQQQLQDEVRTLSGVRQSAAFYGLAVLALNAKDPEQAQAYFAQASPPGRQSPILARLAIDIAAARQDTAGALRLAREATNRWPDRRALSLAYAQAMQRAGDDKGAVAYLRERAKAWEHDEPRAYQMLAQSQERLGDAVAARRDMARYYVAIGALPAGESQLQQARNMTNDFYEQSQIDVQIREIRERIESQRQLLERFKKN